MTTMVTELYDALKEAGASEERARRAAEVVANYDRQFAEIRADLSGIKTELGSVKGEIAGVKGELGGVKTTVGFMIWLVGLNFAATLAVLAKIALH